MALSSPRCAARANANANAASNTKLTKRSPNVMGASSNPKLTHHHHHHHREGNIKVFLISDVHFDAKENERFIEQMPSFLNNNNNKDDDCYSILIIAGDVAEKLSDLERCLRMCLKKFDCVFYTFGNHDLWCASKEEEEEKCSLEKIQSVFKLCERLGVKTDPSSGEEIGGSNDDDAKRRVFIAPVHSWYEREFDTEEEVEAPEGVSIPGVERVMTDYRLCKWPKLDAWKKEITTTATTSGKLTEEEERLMIKSDDYYISKKIDALNDADGKFERFLENVKRAKEEGKDVTVITFSHFLPRVELIPEKRFLLYPKLTQAVGSNILNERIERVTEILHLGKSGKDSHTHAFGHTHFGWNLVLENNVRYVQAALATPKEWVRRPRSLVVGEFFSNAPGNSPLLLYDSRTNAFSGSSSNIKEYNPGLWAKYYEENARDPSNKTLAPWVLSYVSRVWGSRELKKSMMMTSNTDASPLPGKSGQV